MAINLDVKDRKILLELERNARKPNTALGKKVGINPDVLQYRINRLEKKGIINSYFCFINFHKLGYIDFGLYVGLSHLNHQKENEFTDFIHNHQNVSYFAKVGGNYDFIIGILAKDSISLYRIIKDINTKFGSYIEQKEIVTRISLTHFPKKYLIYNDDLLSKHYFGGELENYKLDNLDKDILRILSKNARERIIEMSKKLKKPHSTIISRIKNLEKRKIITGYYTLISPEKYGYQNYNLLIKVKNVKDIEEKKLLSFCENHPYLSWLIKTLGQWDYEVGVEVENQEVLQEIMTDIKETCSQIVKVEFVNIFRTNKYTLYPF